MYPWTPVETLVEVPTKAFRVKGDPEARAQRLQAMLDAGVVRNRAHLASVLGVSRARVTQILGSQRRHQDDA